MSIDPARRTENFGLLPGKWPDQRVVERYCKGYLSAGTATGHNRLIVRALLNSSKAGDIVADLFYSALATEVFELRRVILIVTKFLLVAVDGLNTGPAENIAMFV